MGNSFGERCGITRGGAPAFSGCVAFGPERWIHSRSSISARPTLRSRRSSAFGARPEVVPTVAQSSAATAAAPAIVAARRASDERFLGAAGVHMEGRGLPLLLINGLLHGQELCE